MASFTIAHTIVPGDPLDANKAMDNWNGLLGNFNTDFEPAFSTWKTVWTDQVFVAAGTSSSPVKSLWPVQLDPADFAASSRVTKYRVRATCWTTSAPAVTLTAGLYPVTGASGGALTLGAVTSGSTVVFAGPGANTTNQGNSGAFTAPTVGQFAFGVALSGTTDGASGTRLTLVLQAQQI